MERSMATQKKEDGKLTYAQLLDIPQIKLSEFREQVMLSMESGQQRGIPIAIGDSGLGKTQIFSQIAHDTARKLMVINTANYGLVGAGIPSTKLGPNATEEDEGFFKMRLPDVFPKQGDDAIILFDEINRGLKHAISMFFNLIEDRRLFNYVLPPNCQVAATMNPATAGYAVQSIENEPAIRRRVKFFYLIPDFKGFLKHAETDRFHFSTNVVAAQGQPCHPDVLSFFVAKPDNIYDHKAKEQNKQYTCPATIETVSEDAYLLEALGHPLYSEVARNRFSASIGEAMGYQLISHLQDSSVTISPEEVLKNYGKVRGKIKSLKKKQKHEPLSELCMNTLKIAFAMTPDVEETAKNFLKFCLDLPEELSANMLFQIRKVALDNNASDYLDKLMFELQDYDDWIELQKSIDKRHRNVDQQLRG